MEFLRSFFRRRRGETGEKSPAVFSGYCILRKFLFTLKWSTAASSNLSGSIFVINLKCKQKKKAKPVTNFSACFIFKSDGTQIGKISKLSFKLPQRV